MNIFKDAQEMVTYYEIEVNDWRRDLHEMITIEGSLDEIDYCQQQLELSETELVYWRNQVAKYEN